MTEKEIEKIKAGKEKAAQNNYTWFQQSGDDRYYRAYKRYDDLVEICNQALTIADTKDKYQRLQGNIMILAERAAKIKYNREFSDQELVKDFLYDFVDMAKRFGYDNKYE